MFKDRKKFLLVTICLIAVVTIGTKALSKPSATAKNDSLYTNAAATAGQVDGFIDRMGKEAISFLSDPNLNRAQKEQKFRQLLDRNFDMRTIGRFTLATYWKSLSTPQQEEYQQLFEDLIVAIYAAKFSDYKGQKFEVDSSRPATETDYIVKSFIIPKDGKTIPVDWQVRAKNGDLRIVDVVIEGVSMAITKKSEFSSIIQRGGGNPEVLLEYLRGRTDET